MALIMVLSQSEKLFLLQEIEMLRPIPPSSLAALAMRAGVRCSEEGDFIVCEGDVSESLHILVSGEAAVLKGGRQVSLIQRWDCFGELALFTRRPHDVSVVARTECIVMTVRRKDVGAALQREPDLAIDVVQSVTRLLRARIQLPTAASW